MTRQLRTCVGLAAVVLPTLIVGTALPASATKSVTVNCAHHSLEHAINEAPAGGTVLVKGHCVGTFTIGKNLTLKGNPTATLDANHKGSVVTVNGKHRVTLARLTITNGSAPNGAGILANMGTSVRVSHSTLTHNSAVASSAATVGEADGGAIDAAGRLTIIDSRLIGNTVVGGGINEGNGSGGAIYASGPLRIVGSTFSRNHAESTSTSVNDVNGGAIHWAPVGNFPLVIEHSKFTANSASVHEEYYADLNGGALSLAPSIGARATATIDSSTFAGNKLTGISSGKPPTLEGGAISAVTGGSSLHVKVSNTTIIGSAMTGTSPTEVYARGGAIYLLGASMAMSGSTITGTTVKATSTTSDVDERGGGIDAEALPAPLSITTSSVDNNSLTGSAPAGKVSLSGGGVVETGTAPVVIRRSAVYVNSEEVDGVGTVSSEYGAGLDLGSAALDKIINSTIAENDIAEFLANPASTSSIGGGGIAAFDTTLEVRFSTIADNEAVIGGASGGGGGVYVDPGSVFAMDGSILAANSANEGPDCLGTVTSGGHNVFSNLADCTYTTEPGDVTVANPKLGELRANGGPTETVALEPGSAAIGLAPIGACDGLTVDQRGVRRPQGPKCDAGAFERK